MRFAVLSGMILLICGCASLSESPPVSVSPVSVNDGQWSISAKAETGMLYDNVTLLVNSTAVATGTLGPSNHKDIHIVGSYGHHIVLGICSRSDGDPITYTCDAFVDGTSVGTLSWKADE